MSLKTTNEAPNVVSEDGFRDLLKHGYHVDVVALADAEKRSSYWYGIWAVRAVSPDGKDDRILVVSRKTLKTRVFKTANGLISFLSDVGCSSANVVLWEGGRTSVDVDQKRPEDRTKP